MHCQHHQLPVSDSQKIVTFWFLCIFRISSLLRDLQAVLYVCRCKKFSPLCLCSNLSWLFAYSLLPSHFPCCAFIAPFWVQFFYKLLILCCQVYYFSESFCVWVHPTDNTSFHHLFSSLYLFARSCYVPGFSSSPFFSQCFLPALVLLFASQMFPHGCCAWGCLFSWRLCLCTDLSKYWGLLKWILTIVSAGTISFIFPSLPLWITV